MKKKSKRQWKSVLTASSKKPKTLKPVKPKKNTIDLKKLKHKWWPLQWKKPEITPKEKKKKNKNKWTKMNNRTYEDRMLLERHKKKQNNEDLIKWDKWWSLRLLLIRRERKKRRSNRNRGRSKKQMRRRKLR